MMTVDTLLGIFGAVTGVIGIFLAYHFYRKSIRTKVLAIAYTDPIPLMVTFGDMEVVYEGAVMSALSKVYVLLWNRGTAPIEAADFISPIAISASAPILNFGIQDKDAAASANLSENSREVSINLLRPGEAITLVAEMTSETCRPEIRVDMKSADMSTFVSGFNSLYPSIAGFFVALILLVLEFLTLFAWRNAFPPTDAGLYGPFKEDPGVLLLAATSFGTLLAAAIAFLIVPLVSGVLVRLVTKAFLSRTITPVAWKFFEFKLSALIMRNQFKQFRKGIDAEYKKIAPN